MNSATFDNYSEIFLSPADSRRNFWISVKNMNKVSLMIFLLRVEKISR